MQLTMYTVHAGASSGAMSVDPVNDYYGDAVFVINIIFTEVPAHYRAHLQNSPQVVGILGSGGLSLLIGFHIYLKCNKSSTSQFISVQFDDEAEALDINMNPASPRAKQEQSGIASSPQHAQEGTKTTLQKVNVISPRSVRQ